MNHPGWDEVGSELESKKNVKLSDFRTGLGIIGEYIKALRLVYVFNTYVTSIGFYAFQTPCRYSYVNICQVTSGPGASYVHKENSRRVR